MIKLQVIGHIGNDAIINDVNGKRVINFNVAHSETYTKDGVKHQKTTWVGCSYWTDKLALSQYLKRGTQVYVEGQPEARAYENRSGEMLAELKVRVFHIQLLGSKDRHEPAGNTTQSGHPSTVSADDITEPIDDLPF